MTDHTNPFVDVWAAAVVAKRVARDVLQHIEDSGEGASVNIRVIAPVSGTFPDHPLDTALRDLALATQASSHAAEAACRTEAPPAHAQAVGSAALLAAKALSLAESVAASPAHRSDPEERIPYGSRGRGYCLCCGTARQFRRVPGRTAAVRVTELPSLVAPPDRHAQPCDQRVRHKARRYPRTEASSQRRHGGARRRAGCPARLRQVAGPQRRRACLVEVHPRRFACRGLCRVCRPRAASLIALQGAVCWADVRSRSKTHGGLSDAREP